MKSKITGGSTTLIFQALVLGKYWVKYYKCDETDFIQTEQPYWLSEAYSNPMTALDVGLVSRNLYHASTAEVIIRGRFDTKAKFLDFGGGYGLFARLMRDSGFDFYVDDPHCENVYASMFDANNVPADTTFELCTAWEVLEHLENPIDTIETILRRSHSCLCSTSLIPTPFPSSADDWWYFIPETGQHISLFSLKSLHFIAKKLNTHLYTNGRDIHLFTKKPIRNPLSNNVAMSFARAWYSLRKLLPHRILPHSSLIASDYELAKKRSEKAVQTLSSGGTNTNNVMQNEF